MNRDDKNIPQDFVKIAVLGNMIEAQLMASILTELHIPHRIRSHHDTALDGLYQTQKGWGDLDAPVGFKDEITDIIHRIRIEPPADMDAES